MEISGNKQTNKQTDRQKDGQTDKRFIIYIYINVCYYFYTGKSNLLVQYMKNYRLRNDDQEH